MLAATALWAAWPSKLAAPTLAHALLRARVASRIAGVQSVEREARRQLERLTGEPTRLDAVRASTVAKRYADEAALTGHDLAKLERIIVTESSEAFNAGVTQAAREVANETGLKLWREWDATLDKHTCSVCASLHGSKVRVSESFPGGAEPGAVHPRCRCTVLIVTE